MKTDNNEWLLLSLASYECIYIYVFLNCIYMDKHPLLNPGNKIRQPQSLQNCFEIQYCEESYNQVSKNCHDLICPAQLFISVYYLYCKDEEKKGPLLDHVATVFKSPLEL